MISTYAMRPAFVNFRKEHTVFGFFIFSSYDSVCLFSTTIHSIFFYELVGNKYDEMKLKSCNQLSGAHGWNMRILQQE